MKTLGFDIEFNGTEDGVLAIISPLTQEWELQVFLHEDEIDEFIEKLNAQRPKKSAGIALVS